MGASAIAAATAGWQQVPGCLEAWRTAACGGLGLNPFCHSCKQQYAIRFQVTCGSQQCPGSRVLLHHGGVLSGN